MSSPVVELVGVYDADGGLVGELRYVVGKLLGTAHCALCDITHSAVHRKREWDEMVARVGVPVTLVHLNELPDDVAVLLGSHPAPLVAARRADGSVDVLLGAAALEQAHGSVASFETALMRQLDGAGGVTM